MSNLRLPDALELPDTEGGHQLPGSQLRTEPQTLSLGSCRRPESSKNLFNLFLERSCLQENDNLSEYPPFLARPGLQAKSLKNLAEESQVVSVAGWPQVVCLPVGGWLCVSQWNQIMESSCPGSRNLLYDRLRRKECGAAFPTRECGTHTVGAPNDQSFL